MIIQGKSRRATITQTPVATLRRWQCGDVALVETISTLQAVPSRWLVCQRTNRGEYVVSRHRQRGAALRILGRLLANNRSM